MPKYVVTGGPDGTAGIEIGNRRYEPGEEIDAPTKDVKWLVDDGYLAAPNKKTADPAPADEEE